MRVSDIVSLYLNSYNKPTSYREKMIQKSIMEYGKLTHQVIQRKLKANNKALELEYHASKFYNDTLVTAHVDAYDPISKTVYEIKSANTYKNNLEYIDLQTSFYYDMLNANNVTLILYELKTKNEPFQPTYTERLGSIVDSVKYKVACNEVLHDVYNDEVDYIKARLREIIQSDNINEIKEQIKELINEV
ncbi:MAG: hypothetical protein QW156_04005 [Candidatus Aenigmatarchaeota archaeon]